VLFFHNILKSLSLDSSGSSDLFLSSPGPLLSPPSNSGAHINHAKIARSSLQEIISSLGTCRALCYKERVVFFLALNGAAPEGLIVCWGRSELQSHPKAVHGSIENRFEKECDEVHTSVLSCT